MNDILPVGSEFWKEFPISETTSGNSQVRLKYRVTSQNGMYMEVTPIEMETREYGSVIIKPTGEKEYRFINEWHKDRGMSDAEVSE